MDYRRLAGKPDLVRKALAAKNWTQAPEQAAQLLGLNMFEARALVGADEAAASRVLWDRYHPYIVWYFLGIFGAVGTVGMTIFYFATRKAVAGSNAAGPAAA